MGVSPSVYELQSALLSDFQGQLVYQFCLPGTSLTHGSHAVCKPTALAAAQLALSQEPVVVQLVTEAGSPLPPGVEVGALNSSCIARVGDHDGPFGAGGLPLRA